MAKKAGIEKLNLLRTLSWDFIRPKLPAGTTLSKALEVLRTVSGCMIVLIIDEAQHALNSEAGVAAMFALKAARDQLNSGEEEDGVRMVFTGSAVTSWPTWYSRMASPSTALGSPNSPAWAVTTLRSLPSCGMADLAAHNQFAIEDVEYAFELVGRRPEMLTALLSDTRVILGEAGNRGELLREGALNHQQASGATTRAPATIYHRCKRAVLE